MSTMTLTLLLVAASPAAWRCWPQIRRDSSHDSRHLPLWLIREIDEAIGWPVASFTMKDSIRSSIDQGGGKPRGIRAMYGRVRRETGKR